MPTSKSTLVARSALAEETAPAVDIVIVLPLKVKPMSYQIEGFAFLYEVIL